VSPVGLLGQCILSVRYLLYHLLGPRVSMVMEVKRLGNGTSGKNIVSGGRFLRYSMTVDGQDRYRGAAL